MFGIKDFRITFGSPGIMDGMGYENTQECSRARLQLVRYVREQAVEVPEEIPVFYTCPRLEYSGIALVRCLIWSAFKTLMLIFVNY